MKHSSKFLLIFVLMLSLSSVMAQGNSGQVFNSDNGNYYLFVEGSFSWTEANDAANRLGCGSHLMTVTSQAETDFLIANGWINNYWIGGTRDADSNWTWVTGEAFEYTNWVPGEPSGDGDYLTITFFEEHQGAQWNDVPDSLSEEYVPKGYIVEFECIVNGSFEENAPDGNRVVPNTEQATTVTDITGWEVTAGSVDWLGAASNVAAADGVQFVDVTSYTAGAISQTFNTVQCATYGVEFALSGVTSLEPAQKEMTVTAGGTAEYFIFEGEDNVWEERAMSFTATSESTTLTFTSHVDGVNGPQIDNVRVYPVITDIGFTQADLADTTWEFARADGTVLGATFVLNADGSIGGYSDPNENQWSVENGILVISSVDNIPSTCYTSTTSDGDILTLQGAFLLDPSLNITHVLHQVK